MRFALKVSISLRSGLTLRKAALSDFFGVVGISFNGMGYDSVIY
jgi:hypothetical protein